jgi:hypothetical protein
MSKKSRRRNKKILAALALAGGAAMAGRRKKASIADMDDAGIGVTHPTLTGSYINKKDVLPKTKIDTDSRFDTRFSKPTQEIISKGERARNLAANAAKNAAMNYQRSQTFDARPKRVHPGSIDQGAWSGLKKGGRVTGAAKRGFGRALMKGKK